MGVSLDLQWWQSFWLHELCCDSRTFSAHLPTFCVFKLTQLACGVLGHEECLRSPMQWINSRPAPVRCLLGLTCAIVAYPLTNICVYQLAPWPAPQLLLGTGVLLGGFPPLLVCGAWSVFGGFRGPSLPCQWAPSLSKQLGEEMFSLS